MTDPWADPSSSGTPYAGPPPTTAPPGWSPAGYPAPPGWYGAPYGYGYPHGPGYPPPWGPTSREPRRPGQVVAASVLAFVQAAMVLLASVYVFIFASIARTLVTEAGGSSSGVDGFATEGSILALVQVLSVVGLVAGGVLALGRRRTTAFPVLLVALGVQLVLAVYWAVRLSMLAGELSGAAPSPVLAWFALLFAAIPVVALGLVLVGPGRQWLRPRSGAPA